MRRARARPFYSSGETNRPTPVPIGLPGSREEARFGRAPPDPRLRLSSAARLLRRAFWESTLQKEDSGTIRCTLSKTLRGKRPGAKGSFAKDACKGNVSPRVNLPSLSEGASSSVIYLPTWRGFLLASPLPLGEGRLFMAYISLCDISPQIRE